MKYYFALLICLVKHLGSIKGQEVLVDTEYGPVLGQTVPVYNGRIETTVDSFLGIPFAMETSGERRFAKPVPPQPWTEPLVADTLRDACPQSGFLFLLTHPGWDKISEDCLHLNIYTPSVSEGPYPVMLWLHGGGFQQGANIQYPGDILASHGAVVVVPNYRLNKLGFAYTVNSAAPGNVGLWDQNFALQWTVRNIANFGGDPNSITIFGESAGAKGTANHVVSPQSKDLFHRAILQSGSEGVRGEPENNVRALAEELDCNRTTDIEMVNCLRELPWQVIHNASAVGFLPVIDGPGGFLPKTPEELRADGDIMTGPMLAGHNSEDFSIFLILGFPELIFGCCNRTYFMYLLRERIVGRFGEDYDELTQENVVQALSFNYSPWPYIYNNGFNRQVLIEMSNDATFGIDWDRQVKAHSEVAPTFAYIFNYRGRNTTEIFPEWMGVPHILEIPYVWGMTLLFHPVNEIVRNRSMIQNELLNWTEEDIEHSVFLMTLWTNFAKFGHPTPEPVENPLGGTTLWPEYTFDEMNVLLISNTSQQAVEGWRQRHYAFYEDYFPYLIDWPEQPEWFENVEIDHLLGDEFLSEIYENIFSLFLDARQNGDVSLL